MKLNASKVFNFLQGSDIRGESSYDIWKTLNPKGTPEEFLEFLSKDDSEIMLYSVIANDSNGFIGQANTTVSAQDLINVITQKIADLEEINDIMEGI